MFQTVRIYLVRHCEAEGNLNDTFQGLSDCDITETGALQLECLRKRFCDIRIDRAYSSPLMRAYKTALAAVDNKGIEVEQSDAFTEICGGFMEGMPFKKIFSENPELEDAWDNHPEDFAPQGGEPMRSVYERVWQGLKSVAEDASNEGKTVLIASHGAAVRNLICRLQFGSIEKLSHTPWSGNTAVSLIIYDQNGFHLEYANDASHLPENLRKKKSRLLVAKANKEN